MYKKFFCSVFFLIALLSVFVGSVYGTDFNEKNMASSQITEFQNSLDIENDSLDSDCCNAKMVFLSSNFYKTKIVNDTSVQNFSNDAENDSLDSDCCNDSVVFLSSNFYKTKTVNYTKINDTSVQNNSNKIKNVFLSHSVFKSGTKVTIKIDTHNSIKYVSGSILSNALYKFNQYGNSTWYYKLNTKNFKSGHYKLNIKAIDNKKKIFRKSVNLTADNIVPKISTIFTNFKTITATEPFTVTILTDKSVKKAIAVVRGNKIRLNSFNKTIWASTISLNYKEIGNLKITVYAYDSVGNFAKKSTYLHVNPIYTYWNGTILKNKRIKVSYPKPSNSYEKAVKILSKYATVYEGYAGNLDVLGITHKEIFGKSVKYSVIIAYKDPFVVYHEMAHVLRWGWSETTCDWYAYNKTGYWI